MTRLIFKDGLFSGLLVYAISNCLFLVICLAALPFVENARVVFVPIMIPLVAIVGAQFLTKSKYDTRGAVLISVCWLVITITADYFFKIHYLEIENFYSLTINLYYSVVVTVPFLVLLSNQLR